MGDKAKGLYDKFTVERNDGSSQPYGKHEGCEYFVLDLTCDPFALPALRAYADACRAEYPLLAADLDAKVPPMSAPCPMACPHGDGCTLGIGHDGGHNFRVCDCNEPLVNTRPA